MILGGAPLAATPLGGQSISGEVTYQLAIAAITDLPTVEIVLQHAPAIHLTINATTDLPTVEIVLQHSIGLTVAASTDLPSVSVLLYHDWSQSVASQPNVFALYRAYLSAPGQETAEIPLSSWQASLNVGGRNSYVSAVVPSVSTYGEIIAARAGGTLAIHKGYRHALTGDEASEELFSIAITSIRLDEGSKNSSCSIEGLATLEWPPAKTLEVSGVTYRRVDADGTLNLRGSVDLRVRPGDTVTYDGASLIVDRLSIQVSVTGESMEITGA